MIAADFAKILEPLAEEKFRTASEVKQLCFNVMGYGVANGDLDRNPVQFVKLLMQPSLNLRRQPENHHPSILVDDLPALISDLVCDSHAGTINRALLFLILTATRSGETRGMFWSEWDKSKRIWRLPKERMKARRPAQLPLSRHALIILRWKQNYYEGNDLVFPSLTGGELSTNAFKRLLQNYQSDVLHRYPTPHGMRSTFRRWAKHENYEDAAVEANLAHGEPNKTHRAYLRDVMDDHSMIEKRRIIMEKWGDYCFSIIHKDVRERLAVYD